MPRWIILVCAVALIGTGLATWGQPISGLCLVLGALASLRVAMAYFQGKPRA